MRIKRGPCELCFNDMPNEHQTICDPCDLKLKRRFEAEDAPLIKAWAAKHKCRSCGKGLTRDRYFECLTCVRDCDRELEDATWDSVEPFGFDELALANKREAQVRAARTRAKRKEATNVVSDVQ